MKIRSCRLKTVYKSDKIALIEANMARQVAGKLSKHGQDFHDFLTVALTSRVL